MHPEQFIHNDKMFIIIKQHNTFKILTLLIGYIILYIINKKLDKSNKFYFFDIYIMY